MPADGSSGLAYLPMVASKRVRPQVDRFPWPESKRLVRAKSTVRVLRQLLLEIEKGHDGKFYLNEEGVPEVRSVSAGPLHSRALHAIERAARIMWDQTLETKIEEMSCHLDAASKMTVEDASSFRVQLIRLGFVSTRISDATWSEAARLWNSHRLGKRDGGGKWKALALVFNDDEEALRRSVRKIRAKRR